MDWINISRLQFYVLSVCLLIALQVSNAFSASYPGSPPCVRSYGDPSVSSWAATNITNYGPDYVGTLTCSKDNYGKVLCVKGSDFWTPSIELYQYTWSNMPVVTTVFWNGIEWVYILNTLSSGFNPGLYKHNLDEIKSILAPDYPSFSDLPDGGCSNSCSPGQTLNEYGRCVETPCYPPNAKDFLGECRYCPSGIFDISGNCMALCAHGTLEPAGSIIPSPFSGFCLVPDCADGEHTIDGSGKCYPNCSGIGQIYSKEDGQCHVICTDGMVEKDDGSGCENRCPPGQVWQEAIFGVPGVPRCVEQKAPLPECKTINGITGRREADGKCHYTPLKPLDCADGYEPLGLDCVERPIDCGVGRHQEGSRCVDNPPPGDTGTTPPPPGNNPPITPSPPPTVNPSDPNDQKSAEYLKNIDSNIAKLITSSSADKPILQNIADNQKKNVDNNNKIIDESGKQTEQLRAQTKILQDMGGTIKEGFSDLKGAINSQTDEPVKGAIDGLGGKIDGVGGKIDGLGDKIDGVGDQIDGLGDKLDEQKTDSTGPAPFEVDNAYPDPQQYEANADPEREANTMANLKKAELLARSQAAAPIAPVTLELMVSQNACLSGDMQIGSRSKHIAICFDKPWMTTAYGIMKTIMIAAAYIHVAIMLNRVVVR